MSRHIEIKIYSLSAKNVNCSSLLCCGFRTVSQVVFVFILCNQNIVISVQLENLAMLPEFNFPGISRGIPRMAPGFGDILAGMRYGATNNGTTTRNERGGDGILEF